MDKGLETEEAKLYGDDEAQGIGVLLLTGTQIHMDKIPLYEGRTLFEVDLGVKSLLTTNI